jgi:hypothetical protein
MAETKNSSSKIVVILVITVVVLAGLLFFFAQDSCTSSKYLVYIKSKLDSDLTQIKKDISDSKTVVNTLLTGQGKLETALYGDEKEEGALKKLDKSMAQNSSLKEKLNQRPAPAKPGSIKDLEQCQKVYLELFDSYNLCMELNKSKDSTLVLFGKVKENLLEQVSLLNGAVTELQGQVTNFKKIESAVMKSMETLDKSYRTRRFWGTVKNVGIGSAAGVLAVIVLKMIK